MLYPCRGIARAFIMPYYAQKQGTPVKPNMLECGVLWSDISQGFVRYISDITLRVLWEGLLNLEAH